MNDPQPVQAGAELLVEQLRKPDFWTAHFHGDGRFSSVQEAAPFTASDHIATLTDELTRLREKVGSADGLLLELNGAFWDMASLRRLSIHPWERSVAYRAHAVGRRVREYLGDLTPSGHTSGCAWHCEQFEHECDCGYSARQALADQPK